jgi:hypothetical protein
MTYAARNGIPYQEIHVQWNPWPSYWWGGIQPRYQDHIASVPVIQISVEKPHRVVTLLDFCWNLTNKATQLRISLCLCPKGGLVTEGQWVAMTKGPLNCIMTRVLGELGALPKIREEIKQRQAPEIPTFLYNLLRRTLKCSSLYFISLH